MIITRKDPFTGKINELELNVTNTQMQRWRNGESIRHVFEHLSPDEREFIMTGITAESWVNTFNDGPVMDIEDSVAVAVRDIPEYMKEELNIK